MPAVEVLDDVTPAQHEKKLQGATARCSHGLEPKVQAAPAPPLHWVHRPPPFSSAPNTGFLNRPSFLQAGRGAMSFRTLAFISVAAVHALSVGDTRGITTASPGSRVPTPRASGRSGIPPQWMPMLFLASAQSPSPPDAPLPPPSSPPPAPELPLPPPSPPCGASPSDSPTGAQG